MPVDSITHDDKRVNLPTADAAEAYDYQPDIKQVRYERDPTLDPQLVWRGKDSQNESDLVADAPPIYIQEKIDPRVLIENLRTTTALGDLEPELALFETFDSLGELDLVDFYQHEANWSNRMILGDSLQVMASLAERESLRGQVQMIYLDPPYGIKFGSNWQASARKRDVKDGKLEDAAREAEQIKAFRDTWELGIHSYLSYLRDRLLAARDLLTESGSVFVQIGDENVHLVRSLMDEVFGSENFVSLLTLKKASGATTEFVAGTVDFVIWFAKSKDKAKFRPTFRLKNARGSDQSGYDILELPDGTRRRITSDERADLIESRRVDGRLLQMTILTSQSQGREKGEGAASWFPVHVDGREFRPSMQARWKTSEPGMARLVAARRVGVSGNNLRYVRYYEDFPAVANTNLWDDVQQGSGADKIYVVQTGGKIVERCMLMCTDPGDLVVDPTCGSGTTAYVAEQWGRRWITIDTSRVALALARQRLMGARFPYYFMADSAEGREKEQHVSGKPMPSVETGNDIRQGFVYERVQHITLKSIANNPDIVEGMSREAIDEAIKRHADFEVLYDKPYEDKRKVRVTGPFTVESLSPHRSLTFDQLDAERTGTRESIGEQLAAEDSDSTSFEQSILDNLAKAGVQNGQRNERITFATLDHYPGVYLQAIGDQQVNDDVSVETPSRIAIAIGPQYGTVSPTFIKAAAREAIQADGVELLAVLGFAFDAQATEVTEADGVTVQPSADGFATVAGQRKIGRIPVLLVRMNVDLLMGEDLKKTGAGNLFTVFGEPDIELREADGHMIVEIKGVDVFDPTTGEVRSHDTAQIALWMIDTNYNEESFFVRHCYFTGGNDPYKRLKAALKADIDAEAWESLYRTESRPFDRPETGRIAVKVINDYGDEVMKVFEVRRSA
jgi:adenine-specific DNA-methyltransferase